MSRDISAGIVTDYLQDGRGSIPVKGQRFSPLHNVYIGCGAHAVSYPMCTGALSPGIKRQGREANHSPSSSVEVKYGEAILP
jgi:hypothetical protein